MKQIVVTDFMVFDLYKSTNIEQFFHLLHATWTDKM